VYGQILSERIYSHWGSPANRLERVLHPRLIRVAALVVLSLLSLGLSAAIWGAVALLFSAAL
jgi:hypothetical protein